MDQKQNITKQLRWKQLDERERYKIEALLEAGMSANEISRQINRDRRTIEREIKRGKVIQVDAQWREELKYCADAGQRIHEERAANKGRPLKIGQDHRLAKHIEKKIGKEKYSPDAVIGEIRTKNMKFETKICTKTLYSYIEKGLFLNISNKDLPAKKYKKKSKCRDVHSVSLKNLKGRSIEERTAIIEGREETGHWEMDCVVGKGKACLLVMTGRKSRKELIFKLKAKKQEYVKEVIDQLERKYKSKFKKLFRSITMDNGSEFLGFEALEASCIHQGERRTTCYYAHPYSAWERGSNEVANKLIRRFVPKGTSIDKLTSTDIRRIEQWMNNYPRRMFGYKTANDILAA